MPRWLKPLGVSFNINTYEHRKLAGKSYPFTDK